LQEKLLTEACMVAHYKYKQASFTFTRKWM